MTTLDALVNRVGHLARRWWGALWAGAPRTEDDVWAHRWLTAGEQQVWRRLDDGDRHHALVVARRFAAAHPHATQAQMAAALLHDCGKREAGLGLWGRVAATVIGPRTDRFRVYADHERVGAVMLEASGSDPVTVALVARAEGVDTHVRAMLDAADNI
jgi:hypothetical protein